MKLLLLLFLNASICSSLQAIERLEHSKRWLVDAQGRTVMLRGVNMVNKLPPYTLSASGFGEEDAAILERNGFNAVRVGVIYSAVEPEPGKYDEKYLDDIQKTVKMLHEHGIGSLLDFHQDLWGPVVTGEGFPAWATFVDGLPTKSVQGFPLDYIAMPAVSRAFDSFWQNRKGPGGVGLQDRYAAAWGHVAKRFAEVPGVLGYEIINEPFPGSAWKECFNNINGDPKFDAILTQFTQKCIDAIRANDRNTLIFYEPSVVCEAGRPTYVGPFRNDDRLGYAFHSYVDMNKDLGLAEQYADLSGAALFMTEWGALTKPEDIRAKAKTLDDALMSWLYWTWSNKTPYDIPGTNGLPAGAETQGLVYDLVKPRNPGNVQEDRLDALVRPFPRAIAGTPFNFSYDPDKKVFQLSYTPRAVSAKTLSTSVETEIFVPQRHYRKGYEVAATGAKVVSGENERIVRLVNEHGVSEVTVKISAR